MGEAKSTFEEFFDAYFAFLKRIFGGVFGFLKTNSPYILIPCGCLFALLCFMFLIVIVALIIWLIVLLKFLV